MNYLERLEKAIEVIKSSYKDGEVTIKRIKVVDPALALALEYTTVNTNE